MTRRWLKAGLVIGGAAAGIIFGLVLTRLGKIVAGAPPATLANYAWNAAVFGVMAGIVSPVIAGIGGSSLRSQTPCSLAAELQR